jgi:ABC-type multidrug transport system fused ATPase/permease subunit
MRIRAVLVSLIYEKSLRCTAGASSSAEEDGKASLGETVTLMSVDTERILTFACYSQDFLIAQPMSIIIGLVGLFFVLGWSALAGILTILLLSPLGSFLGKTIIRLQSQLMKSVDARVSLINEVLQGIRLVKFYALEDHFASEIGKARAKEMKNIFRLWCAYIGFGVYSTNTEYRYWKFDYRRIRDLCYVHFGIQAQA